MKLPLFPWRSLFYFQSCSRLGGPAPATLWIWSTGSKWKSRNTGCNKIVWDVKLEMKTTGFFHWLLIHWMSLIQQRARRSVNDVDAEDETEKGRWTRITWRDLWYGSTRLFAKCIPDASGCSLLIPFGFRYYPNPKRSSARSGLRDCRGSQVK